MDKIKFSDKQFLYADNYEFITLKRSEPVNIGEIRQNLGREILGEYYTQPVKRLAAGLFQYLLAIMFLFMGVTLIGVYILFQGQLNELQIGQTACFLFFLILCAIWLVARALDLLGNKSDEIDIMLKELQDKGDFAIGQVMGLEPHGKFTLIYYIFRSPQDEDCSGFYWMKGTVLCKTEVVVWFVSDRRNTLL